MIDSTDTPLTVDLIQRLAHGEDDGSWEMLVERHAPVVLRIARRIMGDAHLAEDACQDAFLSIRMACPSFRAASDDADRLAVAWLLRVAVNAALRLRRHYRSALAMERKLDHVADLATSTQAPGHSEDGHPEVHALLARLSTKDQEVVTLHYLAGVDYAGMAGVLHCTANSARVRVHRALERLRARLVPTAGALTIAALADCLTTYAQALPTCMPSPALMQRLHGLSSVSVASAPLASFASHLPAHGASMAIAASVLAVGLVVSLVFAPPPTPAPSPPPIPAPAPVADGTNPMWAPAAEMIETNGFSTIRLASGKVLSLCIVRVGMKDAPAHCEIYDPHTMQWYATGALAHPHGAHLTVTLLQDGRVLVAGGDTPCEIYDPMTGRWSASASLGIKPFMLATTLLPNGTVLIDFCGKAHCEIFDPATNSCIATATPTHSDQNDKTILMRNGKVLLLGGMLSSGRNPPPNPCEIYDPAARTWSATASMPYAHLWNGALTLLPSGEVQFVGGMLLPSQDYETRNEIYDPGTGTWRTAASMLQKDWYGFDATLLPDGKVLIWGGSIWCTPRNDRRSIGCCEIYDPRSDTWSQGQGFLSYRFFQKVTLLDNGGLLVSGGSFVMPKACESTRACEIANYQGVEKKVRPNASTPTAVANTRGSSAVTTTPMPPSAGMSDARWVAIRNPFPACPRHDCIPLDSGKILVVGYGTLTATCQLFDPHLGTWEKTGSMPGPRMGNTLIALKDGAVLSLGGAHAGRDGGLSKNGIEEVLEESTSCDLYDPKTRVWTPSTRLPAPLLGYTATLLSDGKLLIVGGADRSRKRVVSACLIFDQERQTCSKTSSMAYARCSSSAILLKSGRVLVVGGQRTLELVPSLDSKCDFVPECERYDPPTGNWTETGSLHVVRQGATLTLLADGRVMVIGGQYKDRDGYATTELICEIYHPDTGTWHSAAALPIARIYHSATLLASGMVLVAGGFTDINAKSPTATCACYDPTNDAWHNAPALTQPRCRHSSILLSSGDVLISGGFIPDPVREEAPASFDEVLRLSGAPCAAKPDAPGAADKASL